MTNRIQIFDKSKQYLFLCFKFPPIFNVETDLLVRGNIRNLKPKVLELTIHFSNSEARGSVNMSGDNFYSSPNIYQIRPSSLEAFNITATDSSIGIKQHTDNKNLSVTESIEEILVSSLSKTVDLAEDSTLVTKEISRNENMSNQILLNSIDISELNINVNDFTVDAIDHIAFTGDNFIVKYTVSSIDPTIIEIDNKILSVNPKAIYQVEGETVTSDVNITKPTFILFDINADMGEGEAENIQNRTNPEPTAVVDTQTVDPLEIGTTNRANIEVETTILPPPETTILTLTDRTAYELSFSWVAVDDAIGYSFYIDGVQYTITSDTSITLTHLEQNHEYEFYVRVIFEEDIYSAPSNKIVESLIDITPPLRPINLQGYANWFNITIDLTWTPNTEPDLAGYNVYVDGVKKNEELITVPEWVHNAVEGTTYEYYVTAVDNNGNESNPSESIYRTLIIPDADLPPLPDHMCSKGEYQRVILDWGDKCGIPLNPPINLVTQPNNTKVILYWGDLYPTEVTGIDYSIDANEVTITWNPNTDSDLAGYDVYVNGVKHNDTLLTTEEYVFDITETTHYVYVMAVDNSGHETPSRVIEIIYVAPITISPIPDQIVEGELQLELSDYFHHDFQDQLEYSAQSNNANVTVTVSGSVLTIIGREIGNSDITVTATISDQQAQQTFNVTVTEVTVGDTPNISSIALINDALDYIRIPNAPHPGTGDFTWSVWFKYKDDDHIRLMDTRGTGDYLTAKGVQISRHSSIFWSNTIIDDGSGNGIRIGNNVPNDFGIDGNWHNITITFDNSTGEGKFYGDFELLNTEVNSNLIGVDLSSQYDLTLGRAANTSTQGFVGNLDEVQIWNRVLTREEIVEYGNKILTGNESGLVGYWNFEDRNSNQVTDLTPNQNHGILMGNPVYEYDAFDFDYALEFDGVNTYVEIGDISYNQFPITLEMKLFIKNIATQEAVNILGFCEPSTIGNMFNLQTYQGKYRISSYGSSFHGNNLSNSDAITGEWIHLAVVIPEEDHYKFYINGVLDKDGIGTLKFPEPATQLYLGTFIRSGVPQRILDGFLDDVRIWNKALTQREIQLNMNKELTGNELGLIGYWKFDDLTDLTVAIDSSPNQNHGIIHG